MEDSHLKIVGDQQYIGKYRGNQHDRIQSDIDIFHISVIEETQQCHDDENKFDSGILTVSYQKIEEHRKGDNQ